jgi:hypothetical protein
VGFYLGDYILKLHFGFEDYSYETRYEASSPLVHSVKSKRPKVLSRPQQAYGQGKTTAEVAAELEAKYKIVETFWELEEDNFVEMIEDAFVEDIENVMQMSEVKKATGVSVKETDKIEAKFKQNLSSRRYDGMISGVPTLAAQKGVSHLRQHPYAKRGSRPSFIDTGMYQRSFRAWIEDVED